MKAERALELDAIKVATDLAARFGTDGGAWDWNELAWMELGEELHADSPWVAFYESELVAAWQLLTIGSE